MRYLDGREAGKFSTFQGGWYQFSGCRKSGDDRARHVRDLSARFKIQRKQNK